MVIGDHKMDIKVGGRKKKGGLWLGVGRCVWHLKPKDKTTNSFPSLSSAICGCMFSPTLDARSPTHFTPDAGCHDLRADITVQLCPRFHSTHTHTHTHRHTQTLNAHTQLSEEIKWNVRRSCRFIQYRLKFLKRFVFASSAYSWRGGGGQGRNVLDRVGKLLADHPIRGKTSEGNVLTKRVWWDRNITTVLTMRGTVQFHSQSIAVFSPPNDLCSLNAKKRHTKWRITMCLLVSPLRKSKAKKNFFKNKKISQEFHPHNVLFIFPNREPLRISYLHHLCVMPVC